MKVKSLNAREVLDSRGFPTVEVEIGLDSAEHPGGIARGRAIVPSGASTGEFEALELRDGDKKRFMGKGVLKAIENIRGKVMPAVVGQSFARQPLLDDLLNELDGTENKSELGANAILAVSMAFARATAEARQVPLFEVIAELNETEGVTLPVPLMNIINGGAHADNDLQVQEFMIAPAGFSNYRDALRAGAEVFHHLKLILKGRELSTNVGDEGGFAPLFTGEAAHEEALSAIVQAISDAGYKAGKDIFLALDCASSEFALKGSDGEVAYQFQGDRKTADDMIQVYQRWMDAYPIVSIEDGLSEHDWTGWAKLTSELGNKVQLVGDDLFVTNPKFLKRGIEAQAANSILIKLNQIGTVTETLEAIRMASQAKFTSVVSHRSGETEDTFIADLAVGTDSGQIKTGSLSRTDRTAKYNQLLRIEERLGDKAVFPGTEVFRG